MDSPELRVVGGARLHLAKCFQFTNFEVIGIKLGRSSPLFQFPPSLLDHCLVLDAFGMSPSGDQGKTEGSS